MEIGDIGKKICRLSPPCDGCGPWVQGRTIPCAICGGPSPCGTGSFQTTSIFPYQFHSTNTTRSVSHLYFQHQESQAKSGDLASKVMVNRNRRWRRKVPSLMVQYLCMVWGCRAFGIIYDCTGNICLLFPPVFSLNDTRKFCPHTLTAHLLSFALKSVHFLYLPSLLYFIYSVPLP